ncbi:MAG TPA: hypothetical protein VEG30_10375 [Terriglobales bacterium]|nr:hypothetical protein [Terriglobales bacterium]
MGKIKIRVETLLTGLIVSLTIVLLTLGNYHEQHKAMALSARGGSLLGIDPNYVSPLTELAHGITIPSFLPAAVLGKALGGFTLGGHYVEARDLVFVPLAAFWWYVLASFVRHRAEFGKNRILGAPLRLLSTVTIAVACWVGISFIRLRPIEGGWIVVWGFLGIAYLYRRELRSFLLRSHSSYAE